MWKVTFWQTLDGDSEIPYSTRLLQIKEKKKKNKKILRSPKGSTEV